MVISPVGNCGRKYSPSRTVTLQRLAISTLFASASGMSANSSHISSLTAHILLRRVVTRPFRIVEREAVVNGNADFVGVEVAGFKEADIVGRHHRQTARFRQRHGGVEIGLFILSTGTDQLQKIAVREMLFVEGDALFNQRHIAADQADADVTFPAAGEQNQPFLMFHQPVAIDPRPRGRRSRADRHGKSTGSGSGSRCCSPPARSAR